MNLKNPTIDRPFGLLAFAVMTALLILGIYFMQARMLMLDAPFMLSNFINEGHPMIMEHRYGSIITQIWPWLGSKFGLPLPQLMHIYNASFNVFYLAVCGLLVFRLRQYALAILMALYYTLMVSDAFFWTNNEIHQAIAWMFLWVGIYSLQIKINSSFNARLLCFVIFGFLAALTHPLMVLVMTFVWSYEVIEEKMFTKDQKQTVILSSIVLAAIMTRVLLSIYGGWYDVNKLSTIGESGMNNLFGFLNKPLFAELLHLYYTKYLMASLLFLASGVLLIYEKKYLLLLSMAGFFIVYNVLFLIAFDEFIPFYSESELMPLTVICAMPFVFMIGKYLKSSYLITLFSIIFLIRIVLIINAGSIYNARIDATMEQLNYMKANGITKLIIEETPELKATYIMTWGLPVESLFASILSDDPIQRTFKMVPATELSSYDSIPDNIWLNCFKQVPVTEMNSDYFKVDSISDYVRK